MKITVDLYKEILSFYGKVPPEQGGILGIQKDVVCAYIHDHSHAETKCAVFEPNVEYLNACIQSWAKRGVRYAGMVHSHPIGQTTLSADDIAYIHKFYQANPNYGKTFYPLVVDGKDMLIYVAEIRHGLLEINEDTLNLLH